MLKNLAKSGLLLAAWVACESEDLCQGRKVIELGCGAAALPCAAASMRGALVALATDETISA